MVFSCSLPIVLKQYTVEVTYPNPQIMIFIDVLLWKYSALYTNSIVSLIQTSRPLVLAVWIMQ